MEEQLRSAVQADKVVSNQSGFAEDLLIVFSETRQPSSRMMIVIKALKPRTSLLLVSLRLVKHPPALLVLVPCHQSSQPDLPNRRHRDNSNSTSHRLWVHSCTPKPKICLWARTLGLSPRDTAVSRPSEQSLVVF